NAKARGQLARVRPWPSYLTPTRRFAPTSPFQGEVTPPRHGGAVRIGPKKPRPGKAVVQFAMPWIDRLYQGRQIFRATNPFAPERLQGLPAKLAAGEPLYIGGICASGVHNTGVALIEVTRDGGPNLICNNEEERFSGERHTMRFPHLSIESLVDVMRRRGSG